MLPSGTDLPVDLDVLGHVAGLHRRGRLVAQQLLDGVVDEGAVRHQLGPLVGMAAQHLAGEADEARRGLVPGPGQQADVPEDLVVAQGARRAVLVLELGVEQLGHEVVGRVLGAPLDVVGEDRRRAERVVLGLVGDAVLQAQPVVDLLADRLLVLLGDPEQHADDAHGHELAQVLHEVELPRPDERVEHLRAVGAHLGLERLHLLRREDARQEAAVDVVRGRVLEEDRPGRDLDARLDDLEHRTAARDVGLPVEHGLVDVVPAAQREELVLLVPVQRRLVAQALPHRVRVGIDVEVVRVVVHPGLVGDGHVGTSPVVSAPST